MQLAAHELGIPLDAVFIAETATDKVPNASPTAASASSDMYGGAVMDALPPDQRAPGAVPEGEGCVHGAAIASWTSLQTCLSA